jgi:hypothetical protein
MRRLRCLLFLMATDCDPRAGLGWRQVRHQRTPVSTLGQPASSCPNIFTAAAAISCDPRGCPPCSNPDPPPGSEWAWPAELRGNVRGPPFTDARPLWNGSTRPASERTISSMTDRGRSWKIVKDHERWLWNWNGQERLPLGCSMQDWQVPKENFGYAYVLQ